MNKSPTFCIILGTLCLVAQQQAWAQFSGSDPHNSVTMYGIIDAGVMSQSKTGPTGAGGSVLSFVDGSNRPSIYGFRGTEDLGGGMSAGFKLEGGFNSGNGMHNSPGVYQNQIFGREAKVTLTSSWGTVGMGLQLDPAAVAAIATEPRGATYSFSHTDYLIMTTLGNNTAGGGALSGGIFDQNSVMYSYSQNGLYIGLEHGFGEVAGNNKANTSNALGAYYRTGPWMVSVSYVINQNINPVVGGKSSQVGIAGMSYVFGDCVMRAQYGEFKSAIGEEFVTGVASASDIHSLGLGLDWNTNKSNTVNFAYYNAKDEGAGFGGKTKEYSLMDTYSFSKRTKIYAQAVEVKADANAGLSAAIGGASYVASGGLTASAGTSTLYLGVGIQHAF